LPGDELGVEVVGCGVDGVAVRIARFWLLGVGVWGVLISEYMFT
jgi:hypothetical protein